MNLDLAVKLAVYRWFVETGRRPSPDDIGRRTGLSPSEVIETFARLRQQRVLFIEDGGEAIRMAPPFSGVPTQHVVEAGEASYFANCAWDALGIPAALHRPATVRSRCERTLEPLQLAVGLDGPARSEADAGWLFHCVVPASHWWDDLVFT
jgi:Alkylmercury lyase